MAHFAKLGVDNIVTDIVHVDTIDNMTSGGIEKEEIGMLIFLNIMGMKTGDSVHTILFEVNIRW